MWNSYSEVELIVVVKVELIDNENHFFLFNSCTLLLTRNIHIVTEEVESMLNIRKKMADEEIDVSIFFLLL